MSRAEDEGDPVDKESRRKRAEQKVFESRFFRVCFITSECGENIQRNRKQFEREEDDDEVGGLRHEHHADDAEEEQGVIFAAFDAHAFEVAVGERDAEQTADEK